MSEATQLLSNYNEIRQRLRFPPNAVKDIGIDLKRKPIPPKTGKEVIECVEDHEAVKCLVSILEISPIARERIGLKLANIETAICHYFGINITALTGRGRQHRFTYPRQIMWHLAYEYAGLSSTQLGRRCSGRDHSTVLHGKQKIAQMLLVDTKTQEIVKALEAVLFSTYEPKADLPQPAVATIGQRDLAEEQETSLPQSEICPMD